MTDPWTHYHTIFRRLVRPLYPKSARGREKCIEPGFYRRLSMILPLLANCFLSRLMQWLIMMGMIVFFFNYFFFLGVNRTSVCLDGFGARFSVIASLDVNI